ncbi:fun34 transmembrane protein [Moniliophthora roreri]|nr:fun34 transmembrane protein [Moniliophthora roreri]
MDTQATHDTYANPVDKGHRAGAPVNNAPVNGTHDPAIGPGVGTGGVGGTYGGAGGTYGGAYGGRGSRISPGGPLGTFAFSATLFIFSLYAATARGINTSNLVVSMALFTGGLATLLAGMWEFPRGNAYGATIHTLYGAFWLSYATIFIPSSGILAAYGASDTSNGFTGPGQFNSAIGIYWMTWFAITFLLFIASFRRHIGSVVFFGFLWMFFMFMGINSFTGNRRVLHAAAAFGIITSIVGWYIALSELMSWERDAMFGLPLGRLGGVGEGPYGRDGMATTGARGTTTGTAAPHRV